MNSSKLRSIAKSITWRIIGSTDTFLLTVFISSNISFGFSISFLEIVTKTILYYLHERVWFNSRIKNSKIRHLIKPFSWRVIAMTDTLIISVLIFDDYTMGIQLISLELVTKIILFYIHDKLWYLSKFGINKQ